MLGESSTRTECVATKFTKEKTVPVVSNAICNLYIRGFPSNFNEVNLRTIFEPLGVLTSVAIKITKKGSNAFVCYQNQDAANKALELDGKVLLDPNGQ